ncbi:flagellin [Cupriavidus pinatubonensis]|uniref:Flagellin n=1 Tax=Cupriavidus pinatubonensis TaxID=248026 RepID=A0ABN7YKA8_9BURK|nr:flagellin [Cupriavidus pinatubonensis]CAG9173912.1 hypothetical protein LMG23994_02740 [Cupriavidus pinatubonensis]
MLETTASFPGLAGSRCGTAGQATVLLLLGAGMAYAGTVHAVEQSVLDPLDADAVPAQAALARGDDALPDNPVAAARGDMTGWKPVAHERLEEMRGGFDAGGLQVSFGIERAVYINGALVVATTLNIPDVGRITTDQASRLASTLGPSIVSAVQGATSSAGAGAGAAAAAAGSGAGAQGSPGSAGASASASAAGSSSSSAGSAGASSIAAGTAGASGTAAPVMTIATGAGQVITNGAVTVIQNGPGNIANVGALAGSAATVIQNSLSNQSIRSVMTIDAGVNTLQAFRSQLANTALNGALMRAASMR